LMFFEIPWDAATANRIEQVSADAATVGHRILQI
jgi:hypothetical protein